MPKPRGIAVPVLLALLLAVGTLVIWVFVCMFCSQSLNQVWPQQVVREQVFVQEDGTPAIATTSNVDNDRVMSRVVRTLEGEVIEHETPLSSGSLMGPAFLQRYHNPGWDWTGHILSATDGRDPAQLWYVIHDGQLQGHAWLEGFDSVTRQRIGFIGRQGFRTEQLPPDELFPMDARLFRTGGTWVSSRWVSRQVDPYSPARRTSRTGRLPEWVVYLISGSQLLEIDLRARSVRTLIEDQGLISATVVEQAVSEGGADRLPFGAPQHLAVRSEDHLWIVDPNTGQRRQYPLSGDVRRANLEVYELSDGLLVRWWNWPAYDTDDEHLVWLDQQGQVVRERTITLRREPPLRTTRYGAEVAEVIAVPVPALLALGLLVGLPMDLMGRGEAATYWEALATGWSRVGWDAVFVSLLTLIPAWWCLWRQRRYGQGSRVIWFVFVLLLGPPGLVGYLLHRRWPVREACPGCGQRVPRDRERCSACGQEFPAPPPTGIEVFA
jgi:hypothetical protein